MEVSTNESGSEVFTTKPNAFQACFDSSYSAKRLAKICFQLRLGGCYGNR
jgi:hypothetical protein